MRKKNGKNKLEMIYIQGESHKITLFYSFLFASHHMKRDKKKTKEKKKNKTKKISFQRRIFFNNNFFFISPTPLR